MSEYLKLRVESRRLEDGRGGLFLDGALVQTFDTEAESDEACLLAVRMMVVMGMVEQDGQMFKDEKPYELFGEFKS